jgi:hypothetical protein
MPDTNEDITIPRFFNYDAPEPETGLHITPDV